MVSVTLPHVVRVRLECCTTERIMLILREVPDGQSEPAEREERDKCFCRTMNLVEILGRFAHRIRT